MPMWEREEIQEVLWYRVRKALLRVLQYVFAEVYEFIVRKGLDAI